MQTLPRLHRIALLAGLLSLASACGSTGPSAPGGSSLANPNEGSPNSNFGTIGIAPNFAPDPTILRGRAGGQTEASAFTGNADCKGWIDTRPDHLLSVAADMPLLRILTSSQIDTSLVIRRPDGTFLCDDDGGGDYNALIEAPFSAGTYKLWVGTHGNGLIAEYRIGASAVSSTTVADLGSWIHGFAEDAQSNFGTVELEAGFRPDPFSIIGLAGGRTNASKINAKCNGWVSEKPDHVLVAKTPFERMRFLVRGRADTTLIIANEAGEFFCNDDAEEHHPALAMQLAPGKYRIWVGAQEEAVGVRYVLGLTERPSFPPSRLPEAPAPTEGEAAK